MTAAAKLDCERRTVAVVGGPLTVGQRLTSAQRLMTATFCRRPKSATRLRRASDDRPVQRVRSDRGAAGRQRRRVRRRRRPSADDGGGGATTGIIPGGGRAPWRTAVGRRWLPAATPQQHLSKRVWSTAEMRHPDGRTDYKAVLPDGSN